MILNVPPNKTPDTPPGIVSYSTFVRDLTDSKVTEAQIYDYGQEIELTYETIDGKLRATKGSIGLDNDELLSFTLKSQEVPFTVHAQKYDGTGLSGGWMLQIGSFSIFLIPVLLILVILRQSKTIKTLGDALARNSSPPKAEQSSAHHSAARSE